MGIIFLLVGCFVYFLFGQTTTLRCIREQGKNPTCFLTQSIAGVILKERTDIYLIDAQVIENQDSDGDSTYKIILKTESGNVPLTSYSSSGEQKKVNIVNEIQTYLQNEQMETLSVQQGGDFKILPVVFAVVGLGEIFLGVIGRYNIWHFDKVERITSHSRFGLGGIKVTQYALEEVLCAAVTSSRDSEGDTTYRIELTTKNGANIPMTSWYTSGYKKKEQAAALISDFLGEDM
jgi:hypothetical protein